MAETALERAERRFRQAKAQLDAVKARKAKEDRKLDTRRKVILGGALIDLAERDDAARAMLDRLMRNLAREQDRVVFRDWEGPGHPSAARATGEVVPEASAGADAMGGGPGDDRSAFPAPSDAPAAAEAPSRSRGLELQPRTPYTGLGDR
jgi:hypothetical protein